MIGVFSVAWASGFRGLVPREALEVDKPALVAKWSKQVADDTVFVAVDDGALVGFAWFREHPKEVELHMLYTLPEQFAGMVLVNEAVEYFESEYESMFLWSLDTNEPANFFYANRGFAPDGGQKVVELAGAELPHSRLRRPLTAIGPVRRRLAARVIARDPSGAVLLMEHRNPKLTHDSIWLLPGGMPEGDESMEEAARREFFEETGRELTEPLERVWKRRHVWMDGDEPVEAVEEFFRVDVARFEPDDAGFTALERAVVTQFRWFSSTELHESHELIVPRALRYEWEVDTDHLVWVGR